MQYFLVGVLAFCTAYHIVCSIKAYVHKMKNKKKGESQ